MTTIDDLEAKVRSLEEQLREAQSKRDAALIVQSPIKIGDRFSSVNNSGKTIRGEVTEIVVRYGLVKSILTVYKADGSLGLRKFAVESWRGWTPDAKEEAME